MLVASFGRGTALVISSRARYGALFVPWTSASPVSNVIQALSDPRNSGHTVLQAEVEEMKLISQRGIHWRCGKITGKGIRALSSVCGYRNMCSPSFVTEKQQAMYVHHLRSRPPRPLLRRTTQARRQLLLLLGDGPIFAKQYSCPRIPLGRAR